MYLFEKIIIQGFSLLSFILLSFLFRGSKSGEWVKFFLLFLNNLNVWLWYNIYIWDSQFLCGCNGLISFTCWDLSILLKISDSSLLLYFFKKGWGKWMEFSTILRGGRKVVISINLFFIVTKCSKTSREKCQLFSFFKPSLSMAHLLIVNMYI